MKTQKTVAIVQSKTEYLNLPRAVEKTISLIEEAAQKGAELVVFGETWLTGYPTWLDYCPKACLWDNKETKELFGQLRKNSPTVPGPEINLIAEQAKKNGVVVVIGLNERIDSGPGNGTLYNSLLTINEQGQIVNHHRKLIATFTERIVWGSGDGHGLRTVDTAAGRLGALICWEHWMPMARQTLHDAGEDIHIAVWPTVHEMHQLASRHYAFEGRCFVLAAGLLESVQDLPSGLELPQELQSQPEKLLQRGGSAIIGPDGQYIAGPVYDEECIVIATIDLDRTHQERMALDVTGHYFRNDIFSYTTNTNRR